MKQKRKPPTNVTQPISDVPNPCGTANGNGKELQAFAIQSVEGLWVVISMKIKGKEVIEVDAATGDALEFALERAVRALAMSTRERTYVTP